MAFLKKLLVYLQQGLLRCHQLDCSVQQTLVRMFRLQRQRRTGGWRWMPGGARQEEVSMGVPKSPTHCPEPAQSAPGQRGRL